jgi:hypothetical protein
MDTTGEILSAPTVELDAPQKVKAKIKNLTERRTGKALYPDDDIFKEIPSYDVPKAWIPREYLYGIQSNFFRYKTIGALASFKADPLGFVDKDPPKVCLMPVGENMRLVVTDGHHRIRESGKVLISDGEDTHQFYTRVPCQIYTLDQMVELYNKDSKLVSENNSQMYTAETLQEMLLNAMSETEKFFSDKLAPRKPYKQQVPLPADIRTIDQVVEQFKDPPTIPENARVTIRSGS